ncbi:MAG: PEP-CTERM sorting domain-containing protein [Armatimonadetes bacterium]|nr:PEP-CTERM sorting domain-containing protein [Armatimonadota bacterium]
MNKVLIAAFATALSVVAQAQLSGNLYLKQANDAGAGYVNQEFSDFPTYTTGLGNVVTFGSAVTLSDVQQRYVDYGTWRTSAAPSVRLTISKFSSTPSLQHVPGTVSSGLDIVYDGIRTSSISGVSGSLFTLSTNAAGINVNAGTYLITATAMVAFTGAGQAYAMESTDQANDSWIRNPGGSFGLTGGTGWSTLASSGINGAQRQAAMGINGQAVPEPATMAALGLGATALFRRRKSK